MAIGMLGGALVVLNCAPDLTSSTGGAGDDFPNAKAAVGLLIANNLSIAEEWNDRWKMVLQGFSRIG